MLDEQLANISPLPILTRLQKYRQYHRLCGSPLAEGYLTRMVGLTLEAVGINVSIGSQCHVILSSGRRIEVEVVGFHEKITFLMPVQKVEGLEPGARVLPVSDQSKCIIGDHLCGRIVNGLGQYIDDKGNDVPKTQDTNDGVNVNQHPDLKGQESRSKNIKSKKINPLHRHPIEHPLDVGIKAINGLLTVGRGQRIGLFAGSGVGKSVLMGMMTRYTKADIVVVGLIGERGREVKEFIDHILGKEGLTKSVVVASPADDAPLMRLRAAEMCTQIAEHFRDDGKNVLLLMDSLTRYGQAQREIALSIGEPPATKGYPPSVFSKIPELVERAGNAEEGGGSITAFYTVLTEGDDLQDPIADSARAILDGHIVLSRRLAEEGIYPAIDVEASVSRVMPNIVDEQHLSLAQKFKQLLATYRANKDLIAIGAYVKGTDSNIDEAIEKQDDLKKFLAQKIIESSDYASSKAMLTHVIQSQKPKQANNRPLSNGQP